MNRSLILSGLVCIFVGTVGCGSASEMVKAHEDYEKSVCACQDVACTLAAANALMDATKKLADKKLTPSDGEVKQMAESATKAAACAMKVGMSGIPAMPAMPAH